MEKNPVDETLGVIICKFFNREVCIEMERINFDCGNKCKEPVSLKSGENLIQARNYEVMTGQQKQTLILKTYIIGNCTGLAVFWKCVCQVFFRFKCTDETYLCYLFECLYYAHKVCTSSETDQWTHFNGKLCIKMSLKM